MVRYKQKFKMSRDAERFFAWRNTFLESTSAKSPRGHRKIVENVLGHDRAFNEVMRGGAKSSLVTSDVLLYVLFEGHPRHGLITNTVVYSATDAQARIQLANLRSRLELSDLVDYKIVTNNAGELEIDTPLGKSFVSASSIASQKRGIIKKSKRIELAILDDVLSPSTLTSQEEREKGIHWYVSEFLPSLDATTNVIWVNGTPMTRSDLLAMIKRSSSFSTISMPAIAGLEFDREGKPEVDVDTLESAWEELHPIKKLKSMMYEAMASNTLEAFLREYLLQTTSKFLRLFEHIDFPVLPKASSMSVLKVSNNFTTVVDGLDKDTFSGISTILTVSVMPSGRAMISSVSSRERDWITLQKDVMKEVAKFNSTLLVTKEMENTLVTDQMQMAWGVSNVSYGIEVLDPIKDPYLFNVAQTYDGNIMFAHWIEERHRESISYELAGIMKKGVDNALTLSIGLLRLLGSSIMYGRDAEEFIPKPRKPETSYEYYILEGLEK